MICNKCTYTLCMKHYLYVNIYKYGNAAKLKDCKNVSIFWHDVVHPVNLTGPLIQSRGLQWHSG